MKRSPWAILGIALLFILGWAWLRSHDAEVRARAVAERRADSLRVVADSQIAQDERRQLADALVQDSIRSLMQRVTLYKDRARSLNQRADSLAALDSLRPALALKDSVIHQDSVQIASLGNVLHLTEARFLAADSAARAWRGIANSAQSQLAIALKRQRPKFSCVGGLGVTAGLGGASGGLGITCGLVVR